MQLSDFLREKQEFIQLLTGVSINSVEELSRSKYSKLRKLIILLPKLLELKSEYKILRQVDQVDLRHLGKVLNLGAIKPSFSIKADSSISDITIYYKPRSLVKLSTKKVDELKEIIEIPLIRLIVGKKSFFLIKDEITGTISNLFPKALKVIDIRPYLFRKLIETEYLKITMLKVYVGEEIGGVSGIKYLTIEGIDVIKGEEEFFRRYKSRSVIFHKLGAIVEVEIDNSFRVSINGKIYLKNFTSILNYFKFLVDHL